MSSLTKTKFADIASAIRAKTGGESAMTPDQMVEAIGTLQYGNEYPPPPCSSLECTPGDGCVTLSWDDPEDGVYLGETVATWERTVVVRKAGSAPASPSDGTVVVTETVRNQYSETGYTDTGLANGTTYHYAAFAIAAEGGVSAGVCVIGEPAGLSICSWADGTWDEIASALQMHYAGEIDIHDYWHVGDTRTVSLSAMEATSLTCTAGSMTSEAHVAQDVEMVLMSADHYALASSQKSALGTSRTKAAFVFGTKDFLANGTTSEQGKMNNSNVTTGGWDGCARRAWCNSVFKAALPSGFQSVLKQIPIVTANTGNSTSATSSPDYIFLAAEKEVFGSTTYANSTAERSLKQYTWYATAANRIKKQGPNGKANYWWERSPHGSRADYACGVSGDGNAGTGSASNNLGIAPHGCI